MTMRKTAVMTRPTLTRSCWRCASQRARCKPDSILSDGRIRARLKLSFSSPFCVSRRAGSAPGLSSTRLVCSTSGTCISPPPLTRLADR
eukprot:4666957-Prymnesium_polylepis.1